MLHSRRYFAGHGYNITTEDLPLPNAYIYPSVPQDGVEGTVSSWARWIRGAKPPRTRISLSQGDDSFSILGRFDDPKICFGSEA